MSLEHAKAFVRKLQADKEFREQMRAANETDRPTLVENSGFMFSGEELAKIAKDVSDKDLAIVIGGFGTPSHCRFNNRTIRKKIA
jgi:predicted ribosomally synthesized peptide with nif11-like leader